MKKKKGKVTQMSIHHRRPKSLGGRDGPPNISLVTVKKHEAWHTLFSNMTPYEIRDEINATWLDPAFYMDALKKQRR